LRLKERRIFGVEKSAEIVVATRVVKDRTKRRANRPCVSKANGLR